MSHIRGERFEISLDSPDASPHKTSPSPLSAFSNAFLGDIRERAPSANATPPSAPTLKTKSTSGFPAHKKRTGGPSAFKRQRSGHGDTEAATAPSNPRSPGAESNLHESEGLLADRNEKAQIDRENRQRLATMSAEEIEHEQAELFAGLSPGLIERLLRRSNIYEVSEPVNKDRSGIGISGNDERPLQDNPAVSRMNSLDADRQPAARDGQVIANDHDRPQAKPDKKVTFAVQEHPEEKKTGSPKSPTRLPTPGQIPNGVHFPSAPQPPTLDPSSPNFLSDLHAKYFPQLEHDPTKLEWLAPLPSTESDADRVSPYHPSHSELLPSELRFAFNGFLLPPRLSRQVPSTAGLHHHGDAPEAAGYTVPELARLSRSQVASQRCIAYQTLGRILYRLGVGQFGDENADGVDGDDEGYEDGGAVLARGLWRCMDDSHVLETLMEEAKRERGHVSAKAYAQEALWNWRQGGGRMRKAV